jgi:hypothetical protein
MASVLVATTWAFAVMTVMLVVMEHVEIQPRT